METFIEHLINDIQQTYHILRLKDIKINSKYIICGEMLQKYNDKNKEYNTLIDEKYSRIYSNITGAKIDDLIDYERKYNTKVTNIVDVYSEIITSTIEESELNNEIDDGLSKYINIIEESNILNEYNDLKQQLALSLNQLDLKIIEELKNNSIKLDCNIKGGSNGYRCHYIGMNYHSSNNDYEVMFNIFGDNIIKLLDINKPNGDIKYDDFSHLLVLTKCSCDVSSLKPNIIYKSNSKEIYQIDAPDAYWLIVSIILFFKQKYDKFYKTEVEKLHNEHLLKVISLTDKFNNICNTCDDKYMKMFHHNEIILQNIDKYNPTTLKEIITPFKYKYAEQIYTHDQNVNSLLTKLVNKLSELREQYMHDLQTKYESIFKDISVYTNKNKITYNLNINVERIENELNIAINLRNVRIDKLSFIHNIRHNTHTNSTQKVSIIHNELPNHKNIKRSSSRK